MSIRDNVNRLKGKVDPESEFERISYLLCKTFGWDYFTLMKQPMPFIWSLLHCMSEEAKEQEKSMKKSKLRKR